MKSRLKESSGNEKDSAIVQIAMMIAGLDGVISPEEYVAFEDIVASCGCHDDEYEVTLERGLESAGYVVLQSQRLQPEDLTRVFVKKASQLLPNGLSDLQGKFARKAFMLWVVMAVSDSNYSSIERNGILALKKAAEDGEGEKVTSVQGAILPKGYLEKCERMAYKLAAAQHVYAMHPTALNKNKCRSLLRRISNLIKEEV